MSISKYFNTQKKNKNDEQIAVPHKAQTTTTTDLELKCDFPPKFFDNECGEKEGLKQEM